MNDDPAGTRVRVASPERMEKYRIERERILRAAYGLVGRGPDEPVSVHEILQATGLSTRAFYRHFPSKDELVLTMYRTAADRLTEELSRAVADAAGPSEALEAWIRQYLAVVFDPRRVRQANALKSAEARAVPGWDHVRQECSAVHRAMLAEVIRSGARQGVLPRATDPDEDARAVLSVVNGLIEARLAGAATPGWAEATAHTAALFRQAFGAE